MHNDYTPPCPPFSAKSWNLNWEEIADLLFTHPETKTKTLEGSRLAMEEEDELVSSYSDSGDEFSTGTEEEDEENLSDVSENNQPPTKGQGRPSDEDRKSKNVDALLR